MPIKVYNDQENDLTIRVLTGEISSDEIIETVRSHYSSPSSTKLFLWDMSECSFGLETVDEIRNILDNIDNFGGYKEGEKTAFVTSKRRNLQIAESVEMVNLMDKHPFNIRVFHSKEEATQWLLKSEE